MIGRSLLLLVSLALSCAVHAEKLYKVLDKDGNVSFSQYPPVVDQGTVTVEDINIGSSARSTIASGLDGRYCGKIRLPDQSPSGFSTASYMKSLDRTRSKWQQQLADLNRKIDNNNKNAINYNQRKAQSYNRYNQQHRANTSYRESIDANGEQLRDIRCALAWADTQYESAADMISDNENERERLLSIREQLQSELHEICGEIPAYDPTVSRNDATRKRWYDCSDELRRKIDRVQAEIAKL